VRIHGAGRTDAGVHALGQVAHFDAPPSRAGVPWRRALNSLLASDVCVTRAREVRPDFHARYHALAKTYAYVMWLEPGFVLPQRAPFVWATGPLDPGLMRRAARAFLGTHDFAAFQNTGTDIADTVRTVTGLDAHPGHHECELVWRVTAEGFLKQMVRNIVGCLIQAGKGKVTAADVRYLLKRGDRTLAPATAPPQGLTLETVRYPEDASTEP
jgi:tRNA pseudouridine38-40 synthase